MSYQCQDIAHGRGPWNSLTLESEGRQTRSQSYQVRTLYMCVISGRPSVGMHVDTTVRYSWAHSMGP